MNVGQTPGGEIKRFGEDCFPGSHRSILTTTRWSATRRPQKKMGTPPRRRSRCPSTTRSEAATLTGYGLAFGVGLVLSFMTPGWYAPPAAADASASELAQAAEFRLVEEFQKIHSITEQVLNFCREKQGLNVKNTVFVVSEVFNNLRLFNHEQDLI